MRRKYSEAAHDRALAHHNVCWERMHAIGRELGHDSQEFQNARQVVVAARWAVGLEARRPGGPHGAR